MKITDKVILDLLPVYYAGEASKDTIKLIESYFNQHPDFAKEIEQLAKKRLPEDIPLPLKPEDEMIALRKTKRLLGFRTFFLFVAIFCTALPFAFGDVSWSKISGVHWLWTEFPLGALISGLIGIGSWAVYPLIRKRLRTSAF